MNTNRPKGARGGFCVTKTRLEKTFKKYIYYQIRNSWLDLFTGYTLKK